MLHRWLRRKRRLRGRAEKKIEQPHGGLCGGRWRCCGAGVPFVHTVLNIPVVTLRRVILNWCGGGGSLGGSGRGLGRRTRWARCCCCGGGGCGGFSCSGFGT